jgi:hypothetical protein
MCARKCTIFAARAALLAERVNVMAEFERRLVARSITVSLATLRPRPTSKADAHLTLIDITAMDESVITGNITRVIENFCHDELQTEQGGSPARSAGLETNTNPLADDRHRCIRRRAARVEAEDGVKFTIPKELNQPA